MNRADRFLDTLSGDYTEPFRPVWTADISYWISGNSGVDDRADLAKTEEGYLGLCDELGCMPYYWYDSFWAHTRVFPDDSVSMKSEDGETRTAWRIGKKSIEQRTKFSEASSSEAITHHAVSTRDDLKTLVALVEQSRLEPSRVFDEFVERNRTWRDHGGLPCVGLPRSPLSAFVTEWAGVEHAIFLMLDEPDLCSRLFSLLEAQEQPLIEACINHRIPLVHMPDNLTSEVYTPFFDSHMRGCYERRLERLHAGGVRAAVHLDGTVRGMLPLLVEVGMDAVEAVTPSPVGDTSASDMRIIASSGSTVLWGGVPGALFAPPYDWDDVERHVTEVLETWRGIPHVLGVADQVPPNGNIDFVRRIGELTDSFGAVIS